MQAFNTNTNNSNHKNNKSTNNFAEEEKSLDFSSYFINECNKLNFVPKLNK